MQNHVKNVPEGSLVPEDHVLDLFRAVPEDVLKLSDELEGVEGHNAVVMVPGQQQGGGVLNPLPLRRTHIVQRGISAHRAIRAT